MYAIVKTGGKQYKVAAGDTLRVERIAGDTGSLVELTDVLMVTTDQEVKVGKPTVAGAKVVGQIVEQDRAKKILVFKSKRRKSSRKMIGHRQDYTALKIKEIVA
ncbi:MAG TPA: 50S ribosomal protein L21 [Thermodesulfobacteriota bacterium]|nr:50S ribosomal protein L21 [Thermodesulfobacteriota bacterium]